MWNKNRCKKYSSNVQIMFPRRKQTANFAMDTVGMSARLDRGREGFSKKEGSGPVNWKRDRRNRYIVMGAQTMGTTYHSVRVQIFQRREH
jgi:hypothetical protein